MRAHDWKSCKYRAFQVEYSVHSSQRVVAAMKPPNASATHGAPAKANTQPALLVAGSGLAVGLYPVVTSQYSSTNLYQVSYHIK